MKKQERNLGIPVNFGFSSVLSVNTKCVMVGCTLLLFLMVDLSLVTPSLVTASSSPDGSFPTPKVDPITTGFGGNNQLSGLKFVTKTVAGFVDFVTTVGNTVMIFTPRVNDAQSEKSTFTVTPTKVVPTSSVRFSFDQQPTIGIEGLFQDFKRPSSFPSSSQIASSFGETHSEVIRPSSVIRSGKPGTVDHQEKIKHLSNGLIEIDGAIDAPLFDRVSAEPAVEVAEETYRIVNAARTPTADLPKTITRVASTTLFSNFVGGRNRQVGLVTGTGGTLISNGITTVHTTRVFGTYLYDNGKDSYAQIVQSTAKVFEEDIYATPVTNIGTVQHVTDRPSFGLESSDDAAKHHKPRSNDNELFNKERKGFGTVEVLDAKEVKKNNRLHQKPSHKTAAIDAFKARLKSRFQKFKSTQHKLKQPSVTSKIGRGSITPVESSSLLDSVLTGARRSSGRRSRKERTRFRSRDSRERKSSLDVIEDRSSEVDEITTDRPRQHKSKGRGFKFNKSRFRTRNRKPAEATTERIPDEDVLFGQSSVKVSSSVNSRNRYGGSNSKRRGGGNRFRDRISPAKTRRIEPTSSTTTNSFNLRRPEAPKPPAFKPRKQKLNIKKFNRFSRPDVRQSLLDKILHKGKAKNTIDLEEAKRLKEEKLKEKAKKAELEELIKQNEEVNEISKSDIVAPSNSLTTTLKVSTVFPEDDLSTYLKVATIRSPYSFDLDDEGVKKSTRFITVTRTFTSSIQATTSATSIEPSVQIIEPAPASSSKPFFQTETIPAPENILTSSAFSPDDLQTDDGFINLSSSIETLPAVIFASSTYLSGFKTPPLKTITETFSTKELMLKTSVLPIVVNGKTSRHTLTQTYYVTRLVEAVKTLPPMEAYEFIPTKAFTDFSNVLDEAGSEKREQLLPGELEFSDQDDFDLEGPHEIRVRPPPGFTDDLALIGSKFDPSDKMEKDNNPDIVSLKSSQTDSQAATVNPLLQSSFGQLNSAFNPFALFGNLGGLGGSTTTSTPGLPNNPLAGITPDQLRQLALLQYLQNPFALAGLQQQQPHQQVKSIPTFKTETIYATSTIPLFLGAKKFFTTLTQSIGMTTITEYETQTQSVSPLGGNGVGGFNLFGGFGKQPQASAPAFAGNIFAPKPAFTITSQPIVKDTVIPTTIYKDVKITFRNRPTTTTLTSTSMITTQITSYVTKTVPLSQVNPTLNPFAAGGLGGLNGINPLAALLG